MIIFLFLALILAKIKGYRLKPLLRAYALYPYAVLELVTVLLQILIFFHVYAFVQYASYIKTAYLYSLIIPIFVYKLYKPGLIGAGLIAGGTLLNKIAIWANDGKMPVFASFSRITGYYSDSAITTVDNIHIAGSTATNLKFLTDWIDVGYSILSVGDMLIHSFTLLIVYYVIKAINLKKNDMEDMKTNEGVF